METVITQLVESLQDSTDEFEIWSVSGISEYFVMPFTQTILNIEYLLIKTLVSYS